MTRDEINYLVKTDRGYAAAVLMKLYEFQTADEQATHSTNHNNNQGFNGSDAHYFSSLVNFYQTRGYLTDSMLVQIRRHLPKYFKQLVGLDLQPLVLKDPRTNEKELVAKKAVLEGSLLVITFPYDPVLVAKIKTLEGRKWNSEKKQWMVPLAKRAVEDLAEWGFELDDKIREYNPEVKDVEPKRTDRLPVTHIKGLKHDLFPYQLDGVNFIESHNGRALVGDEMGLGKTCQALAWLQLHPEARPAVIVVPASLKLNWVKEINMWMTDNKSHYIVTGRKNGEKIPKADIYIVNYDVLAESRMSKGKKTYVCRSDILDRDPKAVILDEVHYTKNSKAQRAKAAIDLAAMCKHVISLSGTPILNKPVEMFNAISMIDKRLFPSFFKFAHRYCGAHHNGFGWDFSGASNTKELNTILCDSIMIRRRKADVLKDLPAKMRTVIPMELANQREYNRAENDFIDWVRETYGKKKATAAKNAEALVRIGELKRLAVRGKMDACIEWIEDFIDQGEKLVVFAVHQFVIEELMSHFKGCAVKIDGSVSSANRQDAVDKFQTDDKIRLFVGNIKAAGVGITLTAASNTCFLEMEWTPGLHDQAEDRVHRIGQTADSVTAWYLLSANTMEEEIAKLIDHKRQIVAQVLDGKDVSEDSMLSELLHKYS